MPAYPTLAFLEVISQITYFADENIIFEIDFQEFLHS